MDASNKRLTGRTAVTFGVGVVTLEFAAAVATLVVTTLLPVVARDLNATGQLALLVSGSAVGLFTALAVAPTILDRVGGRVVLLAGLLLTLVGGAWTALASSAWSFAGGRLVTGLAAGLLAVFGVSAAIQHLDERIRLRVIAASTATWILPGLIGPSGAVGLEHLVGWRWTILLPIPIVLLGRLLILRTVPPSTSEASGARRPIGRTMLVPLGVTGFVACSEADLWPVALPALGVAVVGFAALMPPGTLRLRPGAPSALAGLTLFGVGYFGATSLVTLALTDVLGASLAQAGWALGAAPVAWALTTLAIPLLRDRGLAPSPAVGLAVTTAGVAATGALLLTGAPFLGALIAWTIVGAGAGVGVAYPSLYLRATTPNATVASDSAEANTLASAVITTESFGGLVGSTAGGAAISAAVIAGIPERTSYGLTYLGFAAALALATWAAIRSSRPKPLVTSPAHAMRSRSD